MGANMFMIVMYFFLALFASVHGQRTNRLRLSRYTCHDSDSPNDVSNKTLVGNKPCSTRIECGLMCHNHGACVHFQHDQNIGVCLLYSNVTLSQPDNKSDLRICTEEIKEKEKKDHTVFLRRLDGSVDFRRSWVDYRDGFGDSKGEFWLGLERLHQITFSGLYKLRVDLTGWSGDHKWAVYNTFRVANESESYRLSIGGYDPSSTAGDSMGGNNNMLFSTQDRDQDTNWRGSCAVGRRGGWWYGYCSKANPTGAFVPDWPLANHGVIWKTAYNDNYSFKTVILSLQHIEKPRSSRLPWFFN